MYEFYVTVNGIVERVAGRSVDISENGDLIVNSGGSPFQIFAKGTWSKVVRHNA